MTDQYRSATSRRFAIPEVATAEGPRLGRREYRQLVLRVFLDGDAVADARLVGFADLVYQAGLRAGRAEAEVRLYRDGYAAGVAEAERCAGDEWRWREHG